MWINIIFSILLIESGQVIKILFEMLNENGADHVNAVSNSNTGLEIFNKIKSMLDEKNIQYRAIKHEPTYTSEESARVRGEDLSTGGKAILMKIDDIFHLFVLSASKKLDSKKLKDYFKAKKIRFATSDELMQQTGLVPGSVPPFGEPILPFKLFVDESIITNEKIAFNAGSLTNSIIMQRNDYTSVAGATVFRFTSD